MSTTVVSPAATLASNAGLIIVTADVLFIITQKTLALMGCPSAKMCRILFEGLGVKGAWLWLLQLPAIPHLLLLVCKWKEDPAAWIVQRRRADSVIDIFFIKGRKVLY
ncbi:hypothetical protein GH714_011684 [Hevea brasiliensis]|uniref:Uncharacterized protein n=1 Tax=Hevea brasiliensis TaxID=3981 RepID=A0A6A6MXE5_HEVBR|nr:hypothetical protein GH714_011684 [Hevea brasiliensis]